MAGATVSTLEAVLKNHYKGPIVDRLNNINPYWSQLKKTSEFVKAHGRSLTAYFPIKNRDNQGIGTRSEGAALPTARQTQTVELQVPLKYVYGEMKFSGPSIAASSMDETRFAEVVDFETDSIATGIENELATQVVTSGQGWLGLTNGAESGGTDDTVNVDGPGTTWLREGMPIETRAFTTTTGVGTIASIDSSDISFGLTESTAHQVGAINETTETSFELEDYLGASSTGEKWADDRYIFRYGSAVDGTTPSQIHGLTTLIDNYATLSTSSYFGLGHGLITIQGQSRATYTRLDCTLLHNSNSNRALTEDLVQTGLDRVEKRTGQKSHADQMLLCNHEVRRSFISLIQADRQYVQPLMLKGGWKVVGYQAGNDWVPIVVDRLIPDNVMMVPNLKYMCIHRFQEPDFMDKDGSMFLRHRDSSGNYDAYTAMMFVYMEQGCKSFSDQLVIRDVA